MFEPAINCATAGPQHLRGMEFVPSGIRDHPPNQFVHDLPYRRPEVNREEAVRLG